ncbi:hypothetical protein RB653_001247 [Dictyostelium firmibasis]|uniref:Carbohydrate kinase PfkB domain-containing protein n=1 Tax=Dictyostelium firmibasis TaxID=79012 RepID=A0AAN7U3Q3_9MYCE
MNNILFIGNFVNDIILIHQKLKLERERSFTDFMSPEVQKELSKNYDTNNCKDVIKAEALGGSVTYGSLAAHYFGDTKSFIVTKFGDDINKEFQQLIQTKQSIDLTFTETTKDIKNTSYFLNYYNNKKNRTLSLMEKGNQISIDACIKCIESVRPDALLFVPVAGEFDEHLVMKTLEIVYNINQQNENQQNENQQYYRPIIAFDVQGFLRSFNGARVTTRPMNIMIEKLINIKMSLNGMENDIITVVKAEYGEAAAIMGDHDPATCAKLLRLNFGFTVVAVTMGGDGLFLSSSITGEIYIPTFKPDQVSDETGCGDTFLTCTILELLNLLKTKKQFKPQFQNDNNNSNNKVDENNFYQHQQHIDDILIKLNIKKEELIQCLQVGSSGASFLVEKIGPNGFANREKIMERVLNGTKQTKQHYLKFNNPISDNNKYKDEDQKAIIKQEQANDNNDNNFKSAQQPSTIKEFVEQKQKQFKSTTNYK